ncbi:dihydrofolate reductase [Corynebacterium diphtheriae]|uniref:dihydrofolate reductase n=1 Tax=Corynebacterium diphtheriae TaxID=1717 RepID=UPI0018CA8A9C|nr:dihydrofolate reductase [Corynebacterium diphtheriae]MBG9316815.1 dihydrofolate reductase [Corynebacterium diphtheriae bv. mitis]
MLRAIWTQSTDGVIGDGNDMPWHVPEDLAYFKATTLGAPVIMGRTTWTTIPERFRPLPGRRNFVLSSRAPGAWSTGAEVVTAIPELDCDAWIMGGGAVYTSTLPLVDEVMITLIDATLAPVLGDAAVYAPALDDSFEVVEESPWQQSASGTVLGTPARYKFQRLRRR